VDRVVEYLRLFKKQNFSSVPLDTDEVNAFCDIEKYFKNIRQKLVRRSIQVPSLDECALSCIGVLFGMVWDTKDPETVWDPSGSAIEKQPSVCSSGSIPALPPVPVLSNSLAILAEAASGDSVVLNVDPQDNQDDVDLPAVSALYDGIQADYAFFSTHAAQTADAHRRYNELQAEAINHWHIANTKAREAYDALCFAMKLSEEHYILEAHHFKLIRKYEDATIKLSKRCRDEGGI
jgi:hypothetical protein